MVLDGYGLTDHKEGNAVYMANTPNMDKLMAEAPFAEGLASGEAVGLPDGQMGNSSWSYEYRFGSYHLPGSDSRLQRELRMAISSRMKNFFVLSITARRTIRSSPLGTALTVVYTATIHTFMHCLNSARRKTLKMFTFTHSSMDVIHLLHLVRITFRS